MRVLSVLLLVRLRVHAASARGLREGTWRDDEPGLKRVEGSHRQRKLTDVQSLQPNSLTGELCA